MNRRQFIRRSLLGASLAAMSAPAFLRGQNLNSKLNIAGIGVGGKGATDTDNCAELGENLYALCDVDLNTLESRGKKYPNALKFQDYREMLDKIGKNLDAVTISTPDHQHALAAVMAMKQGLHAYVQKPLVQSVYEARVLRDLAKKKKVVTQMGNQGSAGSGLRRAVEVIHAGLIGQVRELHVWSNRPIWPQGMDRPAGEDPVPEHLNWDLWLGPAPWRPFKDSYPESPEEANAKSKGKAARRRSVYHPFAWRGWQDYGTGALGDMACHTVNMPFRALKLGYPTSVEAKSTGINKESYPLSSQIRFEFPEREGLVPVSFTWYDGKPDAPETMRPHPDITADIVAKMGKLPGSGCLLIGDKGRIFSPDDYGSQFFLRFNDEKELRPAKYKEGEVELEHEAVRSIAQKIPRIEGGGGNDVLQKKEWLEAIRGKGTPYSNFDVAAYLTEIILLGCVALRVGKKLDWDGPKMRAKNAPEARQFVKRDYRKGWKV
ncbi:MAG: Gfo/Idh/MocA family oxidoreductase [Verrucomicrobiota bacterium]